jgi:hypothetical protein
MKVIGSTPRAFNAHHPKGRLLTNLLVNQKEVIILLKEACEFALKDQNMDGEIILCNDAYDYKGEILSDRMAIVLKGNCCQDLSKFGQSKRNHTSYKKAMSLM